jgi:hypothetical protein
MSPSLKKLLTTAALAVPLFLMTACGAPNAGLGAQAESTATPAASATTVAVPQADLTPSPEATTLVPKPYLNITRQQYEDALARWRSQGISRYRIAVSFNAFSPWAGSWVLTVNSANGADQVVDSQRTETTGKGAGTPPSPEFLSALTVEGLFGRVEQLLNDAPAAGPTTPGDPFGLYHEVTFDAAMGYPTRIESHPNVAEAIADADSVYVVNNLEVLQQGTGSGTGTGTGTATPSIPGMPTTGNPGR